jgi:hypothetical protein
MRGISTIVFGEGRVGTSMDGSTTNFGEFMIVITVADTSKYINNHECKDFQCQTSTLITHLRQLKNQDINKSYAQTSMS